MIFIDKMRGKMVNEELYEVSAMEITTLIY